ncbi:CsiV family protein [Marinobacter daepoensis]|uniref:CsiV family protein n=2 Tax=Marinobacter daepoensis TaxID=262077 RepID=UPI0004A2350E|nr:CsiV family protein [Marinobacter daepoensis]MBY6031781.1 peptidoglycan binding protein CsiV [Marinobacter daepoensis]
MQAQLSRSRPIMASVTLAASLALIPSSLWAQETPNNYYRAELVILQRLVDPASIEENMAGKPVEPTNTQSKRLWVESESGARQTDLNLVSRNNLHLGEGANRLERSGHYKVLASAGWYQTFPPNRKGEPLRVAVGEWLTEAGQRAIEGQITIDRQRYLHVNVELNHWAISEEADTLPATPASERAENSAPVFSDGTASSANPEDRESMADQTAPAYTTRQAPVELVTWIRETRRMRSEEIHFIDSPTIGVLVFFRKIKG